jgi:hypothetical protein
MAQHDLIIDNAGGATVRADINNALAALGSSMKGPNAPPAPLAGMIWVEDDNPSATVWTVKMYDGADWISLGTLDSTNNRFTLTGAASMPDGTATAPAVSFSADTNTGLYRIGNDIIGVATDGTERLRVSSSAVTAAVPVVLSAGDPLADNQAARKAYVDTKAPLPTASSGVGEWVSVAPGNGVAAVLPAGGTWAWFVLIFNNSTSPAGTLANSGAGVSAGGTTIGAAITDREYRGIAWRIA